MTVMPSLQIEYESISSEEEEVLRIKYAAIVKD